MTLSWKEFKRELVKIAKQYDLEVFEHVDRKNRLVRTIVFLDKSLENTIAQVEVSKLETLVDAGFNTSILYKIKKVIERNLKREKRVVDIRDVTYSGDETIVEWTDGTKTVVTLQEGDRLDLEKGLAIAIAKKALSNTSEYYDIFKKWLPKEEKKETNPQWPIRCGDCRFCDSPVSEEPCDSCEHFSNFIAKKKE